MVRVITFIWLASNFELGSMLKHIMRDASGCTIYHIANITQWINRGTKWDVHALVTQGHRKQYCLDNSYKVADQNYYLLLPFDSAHLIDRHGLTAPSCTSTGHTCKQHSHSYSCQHQRDEEHFAKHLSCSEKNEVVYNIVC